MVPTVLSKDHAAYWLTVGAGLQEVKKADWSQCRTQQPEITAREPPSYTAAVGVELWGRREQAWPSLQRASSGHPVELGLFLTCTLLPFYFPAVPCPSFCLQPYVQQRLRHAFKMAALRKANSYLIEPVSHCGLPPPCSQ